MLTRTTLLAIRALLYLSVDGAKGAVSPKRIAEALGASPSYLSKVLRLLVRAGILRADKGVKGGVYLNRSLAQVTLLSVVEACQGTITGSYCQQLCNLRATCAYHQAASELHKAIVGVLSDWTLAHLARKPRPARQARDTLQCFMVSGGRTAGHRNAHR